MVQPSCARRARLRSDLGDVGHYALDGGIGRRHQLLDVGDLNLPVARLDRPDRFAPRRSAGPPPSMMLAMRGLPTGIAAIPGVGPRPWRQDMATPEAAADRLWHRSLPRLEFAERPCLLQRKPDFPLVEPTPDHLLDEGDDPSLVRGEAAASLAACSMHS
jgi:hypothetical protein